MSALLKLQKSSGTKIEEGRRNNFLNTSDVASACLLLYLHWMICLAVTQSVLYESMSSPPVKITCVCRGMVYVYDVVCGSGVHGVCVCVYACTHDVCVG